MPYPKDNKEFFDSLTKDSPFPDWPDTLKAMWYDLKGDWEASHDIAQEIPNPQGSWIHAFLHRKEGDEFNAGYWYRQAGRKFPNMTIEEEQQELVEYFLGKE